MTSAERVAAALLDGDVDALRALAPVVRGDLADVVRAGLARLEPDADVLPDAAVRLLRAVAGHPGSSRAELRELTGDDADTAELLLERGLVTSRRFERTDCWSRTPLGAELLRSSAPDPG
ncbi:MAG: hypothetical protein JWN17_1304 [Frankiales bacterium]|nr:hypothetical protein [Frankiales bacterium]